jgi:DNA repair exonuclease SbcCD ATPase subunit
MKTKEPDYYAKFEFLISPSQRVTVATVEQLTINQVAEWCLEQKIRELLTNDFLNRFTQIAGDVTCYVTSEKYPMLQFEDLDPVPLPEFEIVNDQLVTLQERLTELNKTKEELNERITDLKKRISKLPKPLTQPTVVIYTCDDQALKYSEEKANQIIEDLINARIEIDRLIRTITKGKQIQPAKITKGNKSK